MTDSTLADVTQRNAATVMAIYEAFGAGDLDGVARHLADDVVWDADGPSWGLPWYEPRQGRDEVVPGFFLALGEHAALHTFQPMNVLTGGDQVAVTIDIELEVLASGYRERALEIHLWTFDEAGRVSRFAHVLDRHGQVCGYRGTEP